MKAVIEVLDNLYLIRIYGSDGICDTYVVEKIEYGEGGKDDEYCQGGVLTYA